MRMSYRDVIVLIVAAVIVLFLFFTGVGEAHEPDELEEWRQEWIADARVSVTVELLGAWVDMVTRHPHFFIGETDEDRPYDQLSDSPVYVTRRADWGPAVEQWRPLVAGHFPPSEVETAMCLIYYESRGNPDAKNPSSSASGLFQLLATWHDYYDIDPFVPEQNVWAAAQLFNEPWGGWSHWNPYQRGLCR